jgi:hypothetical protein
MCASVRAGRGTALFEARLEKYSKNHLKIKEVEDVK